MDTDGGHARRRLAIRIESVCMCVYTSEIEPTERRSASGWRWISRMYR